MNNSPYVTRLAAFGLPQVDSVADLAEHMRLSFELVSRCLNFHEEHYRTYKIGKKSGRSREIAQPSSELKTIQRWIQRNILDDLVLSPACKGFAKGTSTRENAATHVGAMVVMCMDIEDFFPSIDRSRVRRIFRLLGYGDSGADVLASLCCFRGRLPQGAPTSPMLSNLACYRLDSRVMAFAGKRGVAYSRYADDLSFSSRSYRAIHRCKGIVRKIVEDEGFVLNDSKYRIYGPSRQHQVTGLVISKSDVGIGRRRLRQLRAELHGICAHSKEVAPDNLASVQGYLDYVHGVDKARYEMIRKYVRKLAKKHSGSAIENVRMIKKRSSSNRRK